VKFPAKILKLLLSQAISIARRRARMIGSTIAFDCQNVSASLLWMLSDEIDSVTGSAALWDKWDAL
jgi:ubiquinone biosynthesis protein UbiJ